MGCFRYLEAPAAAEGATAAGGAVDDRRIKAAEKAAADASKQLEVVKGRLKEAEERVKALEKEAKTAAKAATAGGGGGEFSAKDKIMLEKKVCCSFVSAVIVGHHVPVTCRSRAGLNVLACNSLPQVADTEKKLTKEIDMLKAKEKRAADAAEAASTQVQHSHFNCAHNPSNVHYNSHNRKNICRSIETWVAGAGAGKSCKSCCF